MLVFLLDVSRYSEDSRLSLVLGSDVLSDLHGCLVTIEVWHVGVHEDESVCLAVLVRFFDGFDSLEAVRSEVDSVLEVEVRQVSGAALDDDF